MLIESWILSSWQVITLFYLTHNYQEKYLLISMPQISEPKALDILFFLLKRRQSSASVVLLSRIQTFKKPVIIFTKKIVIICMQNSLFLLSFNDDVLSVLLTSLEPSQWITWWGYFLTKRFQQSVYFRKTQLSMTVATVRLNESRPSLVKSDLSRCSIGSTILPLFWFKIGPEVSEEQGS